MCYVFGDPPSGASFSSASLRSRGTSGDAFSLIVRLADVCSRKRFAIPTWTSPPQMSQPPSDQNLSGAMPVGVRDPRNAACQARLSQCWRHRAYRKYPPPPPPPPPEAPSLIRTGNPANWIGQIHMTSVHNMAAKAIVEAIAKTVGR